jgi:hypothetical protein
MPVYQSRIGKPVPKYPPYVPDRRVYVRLNELPEDQRARLWAGIRKNQPALARLMAEDPLVKGLREVFGATFMMEEAVVNQLIEEGGEDAKF